MDAEFHPVEQPRGKDSKDSATTRTLSRGLAVLSNILGADRPPTLTELSLRTNLPKATVSRLLATLMEAGFAAQQPGSPTFTAGPAVARWLRASPMEALLTERAAPVLDALRDASCETAVLCVPVWPDRVCVLRSLATSPIRAQKSVGDTGPLTRGCTGRAFLAFARGAYVDAALQARPLVRGTPQSIVDPKAFLATLELERAQGYSISVEGSFPDMNGIAVPVFSSTSAMPIAVLNVSGPSNRWTEEAMTGFAPLLKEMAAGLTSYFTWEVIA